MYLLENEAAEQASIVKHVARHTAVARIAKRDLA